MLLLAIILFLLAAGLGMVVLVSILQDKPTPKLFVYFHGGLALLGLFLVIYYSARHTHHVPWVSLFVFLLAAAGGLIMFFIDIKEKPIPKWLALTHPVAALVGLLALVIFILTLPVT